MGSGSKTETIQKVFASYDEELRLVEQKLLDFFESDVFLIPLVGRYLLKGGGKRIRPLFLLSSARLSGYKGQDHIALAAVVELIHMASLLHDDVIDNAKMRRGQPAAHSIWGNQVVILVGDFLYSNALRLSVSFKNQKLMEALSEATTRMTEGELMQMSKSGDTEISEAEYMKIISAKTGNLISAACRIGAVLAERTEDEEAALARYGLKAGSAFQMADDILDYMAEERQLGKRLGKDLEEGKVTLPLICLLDSAPSDIKDEVRTMIKNGVSENSLRRIVELLRRYDALEAAMAKARALVAEAKDELRVFKDCGTKEELFELADYALKRHY